MFTLFMRGWSFCFCAVLLALNACSQSTEDKDAMTKEQAASLDHGKWTEDYCKTNGWYGDGECDKSCVQPDGDCNKDGKADASFRRFCGGIAGFMCPNGQTCVDDPDDDCDPEAGGRDCSGICVG